MASSRVPGTLIGQTLLFGCGAASVAAWMGGFYACLVLALLLGLWLATLTLLRALPLRSPQQPGAGRADVDADRAILRAVLDQAPIPLLAIEGAGRVRALNRAARTLFATDDILLDAPDALLDGGPRLRHGGRSYRVDQIEAHGAGAARTILALVDIESEERIAKARATRELLQVLSHEVMNALTPIASLAESALATLDDIPPSTERLQDMIGTLSRRAGGLLHFTQAYRQLARLPPPLLAPTSLVLVLQDLTRMFEARWAGRVALLTETPPDLVIEVDRDQISQALWALLQNGAEAALMGGKAPEVRLSAHFDGALSLQIADNGPGVPDDLRARIFQPFFTTKAEGSGIGLSLVRQIAHAHGAELVLMERGMAGACFEIILGATKNRFQ